MCTDCNEITIPVGPTGAAGTNGTNGADGTNGTDGTNGVNAYKFVKQFTTIDIEQTIIIPYSERVTCGTIPEGCLAEGTVKNSYTDIHIQLWYYDVSGTPGWILLKNRVSLPTGVDTYSVKITSTNGDIVITTDGQFGIYRLVVLG